MTMIENVKEFVSQCPFIDELAKVNVEHLDAEPDCYSIDPIPVDPVLKNYLNGSSYRQFVFLVCSREFYGSDVAQNLENSAFYERFADWLEQQSKEKHFPTLDEKQQPVFLRAINWGYAFQTDIDRAQYQIQCRLEYVQKR